LSRRDPAAGPPRRQERTLDVGGVRTSASARLTDNETTYVASIMRHQLSGQAIVCGDLVVAT
jgi:hypothetical protein